MRVSSHGGRFKYSHPNDDFEQIRVFYKQVLNETERDQLTSNIANHMRPARREVKQRAVEIYKKIDADYGKRVEDKLGLKTEAKL